MTETFRLLTGSEAIQLPTGYAIVMKNLLPLLSKKGYQVHHMAWQHVGMPISIPVNGATVHQYQAGNTDMYSEEFPLNIHKLIKEVEPHAFLSLIDFWFTEKMTDVCNKSKVPYINYFPQDCEPFYYKWLSILKDVHTPLGMSKFGVDTVTTAVKEFGLGGWKRKFKMNYIHHGVDTKTFAPFSQNRIKEIKHKLCNNEDAFCFGLIGKNTDRKQHTRAFEAFAKLTRKYPDVDFKLLLKAGDPQGLAMQGHDLAAYAKYLRIDDKLIWIDTQHDFLEGVKEDALAAFYNAFDIYLSATSGEGFGLPTVEAMSCGTPVIITDYSTSREIVEDCGFLVPYITKIVGQFNSERALVDVDLLAQIMEKAYLNPDGLSKMSSKSRKRCLDTFDWKIIANKFDVQIKHSISEGCP
jgi:glycosyltransferase involved in cell wall biosynthesis